MPEELSESDLFVLLTRRRRRLTVQVLQKSTTPLTADELAERIGDRECESPSEKYLRRIHVTLYHNHLPRLEAADVIEYEENEGTVRPGINFDALVHLLERVDREDMPWSGE